MRIKSDINPRAIRAGRAWLGWSQRELADAAGLALRTINQAESGRIFLQDATVEKLKDVFKRADIEVLEDKDGFGGIRGRTHGYGDKAEYRHDDGR